MTRRALPFLALLWLANSLGCAPTPKQQLPHTQDAAQKNESSSSPVGTLAPGEPLSALPIEEDDAVWGNSRAAVTVVAFLDFQCGFCAQGFETLGELRKLYKSDELRVVFKHLPLEFHEQAVPAAAVGQVVRLHAGTAGFERFAQQAFSHQHELTLINLAQWAAEAGVDTETYNRSVSDPTLLERVLSDVNVARRLGVEATPTFFINGRVLGGAQPIDVFQKMIDEELNHMQGPETTWASRYQERVAKNMNESLVEVLLEQDPHDYKVPVGQSPSAGPVDAPVTLVSFSDYECPFCKRAEATVQRILDEYKGQIRVVFKHLPLPFHQHARPSALLASAVQLKEGDQAFFQLSRALFESSPELSRSTLVSLGSQFGLTKEEALSAIEGKNEEANERVKLDMQLADDVLARGTPHFFINGKRLDGARPYEHFSAFIEFELKRAAKLRKSGVAPAQLYSTLQKDARAPGAPQKVAQVPPTSGRPTRGPQDAPVVIHLFSDFECPYCRLAEQNLRELFQAYPEQLRIVWHHFPLPFHKRALPLARAAHFAFTTRGDAGFWSMHDAIFALDEEASRLSDEALEIESKKLSFHFARLKAAMESELADAHILADQELAESMGIRGTPAMVVGEYLVTGARPVDHLARVVELVLDEAKATPFVPSPAAK